MDLLKIGLVSDRLTPMQLRDLAEWTMRRACWPRMGWRAPTCLGANNAASRCASGPRRCWRAG
jgi:hypothetical protein